MEQIENVLPFPFGGGMQGGSPSKIDWLPSRLSYRQTWYLLTLVVPALTS